MISNITKNFRIATAVKVAILTLSLGVATTASAQVAGTWLVKAGYNRISPDVSSGNLSAASLPGTKIDVESADAAIVTFGYMFTNNISAELYLGTAYKHKIVGAGAIDGVGKIGSVDVLPPTLFAQYRFLEASSAFRPYVGLGVTYARFERERGSAVLTAITNPGGAPTTMTIKNKVGFTPQIGVTYALTEKWFADAAVSKTYLKTTTTLSTGQKIDTKLDPMAVNLSIGYRF